MSGVAEAYNFSMEWRENQRETARCATFKSPLLYRGPKGWDPMAFIKKPLKKIVDGGGAGESDAYIDLGELTFEDGQALGVAAEHWVRVAEVYRYEDLNDLTTHVYNGDMLLVDYTSLANDELALKRITADLKNVARDTGGDVAAIGKNWILATPAGVKIDRNKIRGNL